MYNNKNAKIEMINTFVKSSQVAVDVIKNFI